MSSSDSDDTSSDSTDSSSSASSDDSSHDGSDTDDAVDDADGDFNDIEGALPNDDDESRIFPRYDPTEDNYNRKFYGDDGIEIFAWGPNSKSVDDVPKRVIDGSHQPDSLPETSIDVMAGNDQAYESEGDGRHSDDINEADDEHEDPVPFVDGEISANPMSGSEGAVSAKRRKRLSRAIDTNPGVAERIRALELQIHHDASPLVPRIAENLASGQSILHNGSEHSSTQQGFLSSIYSWLPPKFFSKPDYTPLPGPSYIRVLVLFPGECTDDLVGRLDVVDLENVETQYEAISYQWGHPDVSSDPITLSGRLIFLSTTLMGILMSLRLKDRNRVLWADALCINQADHAERMQQVGMMQHIYSRAHRVVVCLGAKTHTTTKYFGAVKMFASAWLDFQKQSGLKNGLEEPPAGVYKGFGMGRIASIFENSYWTRLWVVQEVVSSRRAMVHWGNEEISWTLLGLVTVLIRNNGSLWSKFTSLHNALAISGLMNAYLMYRLPSAEFGSNSMSFLDMLRLTRNFNVTVPLDRIYAILGLPSQHTGEEQKFIEADYRLLKEGLYTRVFHRVLTTHEIPLEILSAVRHTTLFYPDFPTWVPQWRLDPIRSIGGSHREVMKFDASAGGPAKPLIQVIWRLEQRSLTVEGFTLGRIVSSHLIFPKSLSETPSQRKRQMKKHGTDAVTWVRKHIQQDGLISKLALTLTAGQDWYSAIFREQTGVDRHVRCFLKWARKQRWNTSSMFWPQLAQPGDNVSHYSQAVRNVSRGRKLFAATGNILGLGPNLVRPGDVVCVILGGPVPYILRPLGDDLYYFVGECFVPGYMFGEALVRARNKGWQLDRFVLK